MAALSWPGVYAVRVGVALNRPPREDAVIWVQIQAENEIEAELAATHMACCFPSVVMPVSSEVVSCVL